MSPKLFYHLSLIYVWVNNLGDNTRDIARELKQ